MITLRFIPCKDALALSGARVVNDATGEELAQLRKVVYEHEAGCIATLTITVYAQPTPLEGAAKIEGDMTMISSSRNAPDAGAERKTV